jgi:2-polyprenyl-3-methyl-5-hydroxy-6-metoxy-1,4-benzoquinol methylase
MTAPPGEPDYKVWEAIDYKPAITDLLPNRLLSFLRPASVILDVGCNTGGVALFLAERGHTCKGIDINEAAIATARDCANRQRLSASTSFQTADFREFVSPCRFDAVLMTRFLTCVPQAEHWRAILDKAFALLRADGLIYVHDFLWVPNNPAYGPRYADGAARGWREGNFEVRRSDGSLQFIAHHHTKADLDTITMAYNVLCLEEHDSLSMNGNPCRMFEFIGRKRCTA